MKYRYFLAIAALRFTACGVLSWMDVDENTPPLIVGLASAGFRLTLRLLLIDIATGRAIETVERTRTFTAEAAPKPGP